MKPIHLFWFVLIAVAAAGGWFAARHWGAHPAPGSDSASGRRILYYQSAMHPWIKSDKPGRCTICGMELTPVYEGDKGFDAEGGVTALSSNIIQVINVQTEEVHRQPLRRILRVAGTIDDDDTRHRIVSAYVDARIDKLSVNYVGAEVVTGQPLVTFYSAVLLAAEREYAVLQKQPHSAGSPPALSAEHTRLIEAAAQRLKRYGLSEVQIAALHSKDEDDIHSEILAPVSGSVVARFVYEGQYVKQGDRLFEIADFSNMWFQFDAYERDLAWLKPGQKVIVTTPAVPGKDFLGTIAFIDPNLKEMTRSAKVRVELPNPLVETGGRKHRELFHKLYAEGAVQIEIPEVLAVPRSAVLAPGPQAVVYVAKGEGAYEQRKLKLGRLGEDMWEVLEGLSEGERVVTSGNMLIDAQAQLNASANQPPAAHQHVQALARPAATASSSPEVPGPLPTLTAEQQKAAQEFLALADAITTALASDDLVKFNTLSAKTHAAVPGLGAEFPKESPWRSLIGRVESTGHIAGANDLKSARKSFHPLSEATVALAKALRKQEAGFKSVKVYRCPMTKDAFPDAPRTAEWIQFTAPIRNPYFGAEMLDCGSEVKP